VLLLRVLAVLVIGRLPLLEARGLEVLVIQGRCPRPVLQSLLVSVVLYRLVVVSFISSWRV
jgi:hypothetical protein